MKILVGGAGAAGLQLVTVRAPVHTRMHIWGRNSENVFQAVARGDLHSRSTPRPRPPAGRAAPPGRTARAAAGPHRSPALVSARSVSFQVGCNGCLVQDWGGATALLVGERLGEGVVQPEQPQPDHLHAAPASHTALHRFLTNWI